MGKGEVESVEISGKGLNLKLEALNDGFKAFSVGFASQEVVAEDEDLVPLGVVELWRVGLLV